MFKKNFWLTVFAIYQLFSTALIAIGVWPTAVVYLNLAIQLGAIWFFDLEYALYSVILTIPFYLVVPNPKFDSLSAWRFTFAALVAVLWWKQKYRANRKLKLFSWDGSLIWLVVAIVASVLIEPFKTPGIKKLTFVINVYFLYIAVLNIIDSKEKILRLVKTAFASTASIVLLGFVQLAASLTLPIYDFWQYWATMISRVYYGKTLADTLVYSNSWFTFSKNAAPQLRMFSILPDSHAFAVIAMFSVPLAAGLLYFVSAKTAKILLWIYIVLAMLAIIFSGTRGVWVGILAPLLVLIYLGARHWGRKLLRWMFVPLLIFFVLFALSPMLQKALSAASGLGSASFLQRAESVYNLNDVSNSGRIAIWKNTLKFAVSHPLLGAGFGDFVITLGNSSGNPSAQNYQQLANQKNSTYNLPNQYITAHNLYLDFLGETGLLGLLAFLFYAKNIFREFWRFFKKHYLYAEDGYVFLAVNIGLYLLWLFAYSFVDGTLINDRVLAYFFLMLGISASIMKVYATEHA